MKAPSVTSSHSLRGILLVAVAIALCAAALSACGGGSAVTDAGVVSGAPHRSKVVLVRYVPRDRSSCGGDVSVNAHTSCPFAQAVEQAYFETVGSGPGVVVAYSPVTERSYTMTCGGSPHECAGGDHAVVYFP